MRGMEHWLLRPEVREHWRQLQGGWLWCWLSKSQRAMEWKTYFLSTVHLRRWVRVDWSDTLPGELFILSKTKSSIEIKSNGFFATRQKSPWTKWGCSSPTPTWSSPWGATERIRLNFTIQRLHQKDSVWFFLSQILFFLHHFSRKVSIANATAASGLDFHFKRNLLFFTDTDKRKVNPSSFKSV